MHKPGNTVINQGSQICTRKPTKKDLSSWTTEEQAGAKISENPKAEKETTSARNELWYVNIVLFQSALVLKSEHKISPTPPSPRQANPHQNFLTYDMEIMFSNISIFQF